MSGSRACSGAALAIAFAWTSAGRADCSRDFAVADDGVGWLAGVVPGTGSSCGPVDAGGAIHAHPDQRRARAWAAVFGGALVASGLAPPASALTGLFALTGLEVVGGAPKLHWGALPNVGLSVKSAL